MTKRKDKTEKSGLVVNYVPSWEIPIALKTADWTIKGGSKFIEWLRDEGPLAIQILDSCNKEDRYIVEFRATNLSIHAIYLNSFNLSFPDVGTVELKPKLRRTIGWHDSDEEKTDSTLIKSRVSLDFTIEFDIPHKEDLRKGILKSHVPMGSGRVSFLILNEAKERYKDITFSIRVAD